MGAGRTATPCCFPSRTVRCSRSSICSARTAVTPERGKPRPENTVVPAKAGTHNPKKKLWREAVTPSACNHAILWLWVPAFAGMTSNLWPDFALNDEEKVTKYAQAILDRTELSLWMTTSYMPRTRDMSASRRRLLRAWCRKVS